MSLPGTTTPLPTAETTTPLPDADDADISPLVIHADVNALLNRFGGNEATLFTFLDKLNARYG
jgi:hypothetical protein